MIAFTGLYLLWFTKKQKAGKILASAGLLLSFLFSNNYFANSLLFRLENRYPMYSTESPGKTSSLPTKHAIEYVVVLGGGHTTFPTLPITSQLNEPVIVRLVEGIRIFRQHQGTKLILSGGASADPYPNAKLLADLAVELGVNKDDIILELESKDTKDEARLIKPLVGDKPFALVTSASHMPRSVALFRKVGMNPIPAPTDHLVKNRHSTSYSKWFPSSTHLQKSERAVYETLGILWAKLRKQI
jgi:uncharacterized SAM-binding protein YcdF (DUF218 family)